MKIAIYCTGDIWQSGGGGIVMLGVLENIRSDNVILFVSNYVDIPSSISSRFNIVRLKTPRNRLLLELFDQVCAPLILLLNGVNRVLCLNSIVPILFPHDKFVFYQMRMFHFEEIDNIKKRIKNKLGVLSLRACEKVFVASNDHRSDLLRHLNLAPDKVEVALLGFNSVSVVDDDIVGDVIGGDSGYLLFVSVLRPYKNLHSLVDAYIDLHRESINNNIIDFPDLLIVGGVPDYLGIDEYLSNIRFKVSSSGLDSKIKFLGPKTHKEVVSLLRGARLFVFPSLFEGFGLPVLEAMALGVPVACSNVHSMPEVGGDVVLYFDPKDVDSLKRAIQLGVSNYPVDLIPKAIARASEFTWKRTVTAIENSLFRNI